MTCDGKTSILHLLTVTRHSLHIIVDSMVLQLSAVTLAFHAYCMLLSTVGNDDECDTDEDCEEDQACLSVGHYGERLCIDREPQFVFCISMIVWADIFHRFLL